ncbi:MAG: hypothetical protein V1660_04325 [archaeon]
MKVKLQEFFDVKKFTNQTRMKEIKDEMKKLQDQSKQAAGNNEKMLQIQNDMMKLSGEQMKASMKVTLITMLPFILIFGFMKGIFNKMGDLITWGVNIPWLGGTGAGWFVSYIVISIFSSIILRKLMKIH